MMPDWYELDFNGIKLEISYDLYPGKHPIIFIHGLGCAKETFNEVLERDVLKDNGILLFDLPGFGDSPCPMDFTFDMLDHARIVKEILDGLRIDKFHLVCHSMGGAVGLLLYDIVPDRISSLVNLEGNLIRENCDLSRNVYNVFSFEEFKDQFFIQLKNSIKESDEPNADRIHNMLCRCDPFAFYKSGKSLVKWSDSGKLLDIFLDMDIIKKYVHGDRNFDMPAVRRIKPQVDIICIKKSGHFMMMDNPNDLYRAIENTIH